MKRYAIFSDVHGNLEALQSVLDDIKERDIEEIICLGDVISYGPDSKQCLNILRENNVRLILGEQELYFLHGVNINKMATKMEETQIEWVSKQLDDDDREYLSQCDLYYEIDTKLYKHRNNIKLFSHFLITDEKKSYPFEKNELKYNLQQWLNRNHDYSTIFIGGEHDTIYEEDVEGVDGDFENTFGVVSNLWPVGSIGCDLDDKISYVILEINYNNKSITTTTFFVSYNKNKFLEKLFKLDYPYKKEIHKTIYKLDI